MATQSWKIGGQVTLSGRRLLVTAVDNRFPYPVYRLRDSQGNRFTWAKSWGLFRDVGNES